MNGILIILTLLGVLCLSLSIRLFFETLFGENSLRDDIEEKMIFLSEFLNKEFTIFSTKFKPLEIFFLIGILPIFTILKNNKMALEISGKIFALLPEQTGNGKNGAWVKQDFVIETQEQFPKKVCLSAWGDKAPLVKSLGIGSTVKVSFNAESREFNGKWYTDLRVWKIDGAKQASGASDVPLPDAADDMIPMSDNDSASDLPF